MRILPGVDEARVVGGAPAKVLYAREVWSFVVEFTHVVESEELEGFSVASAVGKQVEEGEELRETVFT